MSLADLDYSEAERKTAPYLKALALKAVGGQQYEAIINLMMSPMGISQVNLEVSLVHLMGYPFGDPRITTARMNFVGSLRSWGFVVSGGRKGGSFYRIEGWAEKVAKPDISQWVGLSKETYEWVRTFQPFKDDRASYDRFKLFVSQRSHSDIKHENCFLYLWAYELTKSQGWFFSPGWMFGGCVVIQKFYNYPQFKIFNLFSQPGELLSLAERLAPASTRPVRIINIPEDQINEYRRLHPQGSWSHREEGIYDVVDIAEHPDKYLNKRAMTTLRAREKDTTFLGGMPRIHQHQIVDTWKSFNEPKHRQLAITRDHRAIDSMCSSKITFGGYREGQPVIHHLFDILANNPEVVSLMNEKSLNYSDMPGGKPGLSDYNQVMTCRALAERGIKYIQSGGLDGGGIGLPDKKKKYTCQLVFSHTFFTAFPISTYA